MLLEKWDAQNHTILIDQTLIDQTGSSMTPMSARGHLRTNSHPESPHLGVQPTKSGRKRASALECRLLGVERSCRRHGRDFASSQFQTVRPERSRPRSSAMVAVSRVTGGVALDQIAMWSAKKNFTKKIWTPGTAEYLGRFGRSHRHL